MVSKKRPWIENQEEEQKAQGSQRRMPQPLRSLEPLRSFERTAVPTSTIKTTEAGRGVFPRLRERTLCLAVPPRPPRPLRDL